MNRITTRLLAGALFCGLTTTATAQVSAADSVMNHVKGNRLSLGGYGEAATFIATTETVTPHRDFIKTTPVMGGSTFPMQ